jgi:hypothetical protein
MSNNRNNYYKLYTTYKSCNCSGYKSFVSQKECPKQVADDLTSKESYGAFSLRGALRPPYGSGQYYSDEYCGCESGCTKCRFGQCTSPECIRSNMGVN